MARYFLLIILFIILMIIIAPFINFIKAVNGFILLFIGLIGYIILAIYYFIARISHKHKEGDD